jgi:glycosyltransferase involved in cell wall biosynthesis
LDSPDISVVVPSFNKSRYVEEALRSILNQTACRVQIIFVDAGSTDGTIEKAEALFNSQLAKDRVESGWDIIKIVEPDRGQSHAINKGLLRASGQIVCWLNADDVYRLSALDRVVSQFRSRPDVGLIFGDLDTIDENGNTTGTRRSRPWNRRQLLDSYCYIPQPATFWRRELIALAGLLDVELFYAMDYDYWLRLSRYTTVARVDHVLAAIRIMDGTKTGTSPLNAMPEALRVGRRHGARYLSKFRMAYWLWRVGARDLVRWAAKRTAWSGP